MKSLSAIKEFIKENVELNKVLIDYRVDFTGDPFLMDEVQLRCPFHGRDTKPSARYYKSTGLFYCWVCMKSWDVTRFIMQREQINYKRALLFIVDRYRLDISHLPDEPIFKNDEKKTVPQSEMKMALLKNKIRGHRGKLVFEKYNTLCIAYYMVYYRMALGEDVLAYIEKLEKKLESLS